jgi:hypothetical protein
MWTRPVSCRYLVRANQVGLTLMINIYTQTWLSSVRSDCRAIYNRIQLATLEKICYRICQQSGICKAPGICRRLTICLPVIHSELTTHPGVVVLEILVLVHNALRSLVVLVVPLPEVNHVAGLSGVLACTHRTDSCLCAAR